MSYNDFNPTRAIHRAWQAGMTLSEAYRHLNKRFGFTDKPQLIAEWRSLKRQFGCGCMPLSYLEGWRSRGIQPDSAAALTAPISALAGGVTYGDWKGITGPGKRLREILAAERKQKADDK